jgi:hypothetical protein
MAAISNVERLNFTKVGELDNSTFLPGPELPPTPPCDEPAGLDLCGRSDSYGIRGLSPNKLIAVIGIG